MKYELTINKSENGKYYIDCYVDNDDGEMFFETKEYIDPRYFFYLIYEALNKNKLINKKHFRPKVNKSLSTMKTNALYKVLLSDTEKEEYKSMIKALLGKI